MLHWMINAMIASMIFFPEKGFYETPDQYNFDYEDVVITTSDNVKIHGWFLKAQQETGVILFLHGNAGNISHRLFKAKGWIDRGFSIFLVDYRGYGKSAGKIKHQDNVYSDVDAAFQWLIHEKNIPINKIILYGESLGSAAVTKLAEQNKVWAIILEAPFTSFLDLTGIHYPLVPKVLVKDFSFSNIDRIHNMQSPLLILHGTKDDICPIKLGQMLFEKAPSPKEFISVEQGNHNNLVNLLGDDFWQKPYDFLMKHRSD